MVIATALLTWLLVSLALPIAKAVDIREKQILKKMTKEPKLKWGDRTAARADEVEYSIGIRVVDYTSLKDVIIVEVHESVTDEVAVTCL